MKHLVKLFLQKILGYRVYLLLFARYKTLLALNGKIEDEIKLFTKLCEERSGDIIDVGANLGWMTIYLAKRFPDKTIHSFEPETINFSVLKRGVEKSGCKNVRLYNLAVGSKSGTVELIIPKINSVLMQGLVHVNDPSITDFADGDRMNVEMVSLDSIFTLHVNGIAGVKIDVENYEQFVILGAQSILRDFRPIITCELWDNDNKHTTMRYLDQHGFTPFVRKGERLVPLENNDTDTVNYFFLPRQN